MKEFIIFIVFSLIALISSYLVFIFTDDILIRFLLMSFIAVFFAFGMSLTMTLIDRFLNK